MAISNPDGSITYAGRTLGTHASYIYDDDRPLWWATVLTDEGQVGSIPIGRRDDATLDATPETMAAAREYVRKGALASWMHKNETNARAVQAGKEVIVVGGRKHKGKSGICTWAGISHSAYSSWSQVHRARVQPAEGEAFFIDLHYLEVADWGQYLEPFEEGEEAAQREAEGMKWGRR